MAHLFRVSRQKEPGEFLTAHSSAVVPDHRQQILSRGGTKTWVSQSGTWPLKQAGRGTYCSYVCGSGFIHTVRVPSAARSSLLNHSEPRMGFGISRPHKCDGAPPYYWSDDLQVVVCLFSGKILTGWDQGARMKTTWTVYV